MEYTPTKFSTVEDKLKFENQFKKFVESDFSEQQFPKWFYIQLSMCFGHIAHYDWNNFYTHFFLNSEDKQEFINQTINYPCYGDPAYTYSDVESVLRSWTSGYISGKL